MAKNHPLMKDVKNWILDSFSFMDGIGYDIQFADDIFGMENTKAFSIDIDGLTDFDFEKGKKNLLKSIPNKIKAEFPYLRISSTRDGNYFVMFITLLDNNDYLEDTKLTYINLNESKKSAKRNLKENRFDDIIRDVENLLLDPRVLKSIEGYEKDYTELAYMLAERLDPNDYAMDEDGLAREIKDMLIRGKIKITESKHIKESSIRCVTFEQIADSRFDDISKGEKILNDRKDEIIELCGDDFSVYTNKIEFLDWGDDESQYRQRYYIRKNNNNVSWNDLYKIVNSVKAVPYKFDKINDSVFESRKSIKESVEFFNDFGTGVYCATSSNGWTFCYCPLSWINKKGVEDLIGWSVMDDKAHYIDGDSWENKTDEEINDSIDNFEKLIKKYAKEDSKEIIKDFRSTLEKD